MSESNVESQKLKGDSGHIPVLLHEVIEGLSIKKGATVVDATLGRAGHARIIADKIGEEGRLIAIDADYNNIVHSEEILGNVGCKVEFVNDNFRRMEVILGKLLSGYESVDGFIFDLGLNSIQLDESGRGFSFLSDEPLIMTLSTGPDSDAVTASDIINGWSQESIETILRGFGGEQFAGRIARHIVEARARGKIRTTLELATIVRTAVPDFYKKRRINCATKTFQALRIAVNDEFGAIKEGISGAWRYLKNGGRIAVISFHDGEDRIVKSLYRDMKKSGGRIINKKVIVPSRDEIRDNPRSRSAKLRIIEKNEV